jgi:hypothetical protein
MVAVRGFVITLMPDFSRVEGVVQETFAFTNLHDELESTD